MPSTSHFLTGLSVIGARRIAHFHTGRGGEEGHSPNLDVLMKAWFIFDHAVRQ
jgi:hypothetical protein